MPIGFRHEAGKHGAVDAEDRSAKDIRLGFQGGQRFRRRCWIIEDKSRRAVIGDDFADGSQFFDHGVASTFDLDREVGDRRQQ